VTTLAVKWSSISHKRSLEVALGEHVEDGTLAAIKVLHEPLTNENIKEFVNEAGLCELLRHESIVRLLDVGIRDDQIPFLAMEYAPNGSLADLHPRGTRLPLDTIIFRYKA
jgi:serine/threonine protein kinase